MNGVASAMRAGYVASELIFGHAALNLCWAIGGTALVGLLSDGIQEQLDLREPLFMAMTWSVALLKGADGLIGLALT